MLVRAIAALMIAGASAPAVAAAANPVKAASPFIDRANREWTVAIRTGDADVLSAPYAEDAVFILPNGSSVKGHAAIHDLYARRPPAGTVVDAGLQSSGRAAAGADDVYEWGMAWTVVRTPNNARTRRGGRYLTVWHRYADGRWLITRNIAF